MVVASIAFSSVLLCPSLPVAPCATHILRSALPPPSISKAEMGSVHPLVLGDAARPASFADTEIIARASVRSYRLASATKRNDAYRAMDLALHICPLSWGYEAWRTLASLIDVDLRGGADARLAAGCPRTPTYSNIDAAHPHPNWDVPSSLRLLSILARLYQQGNNNYHLMSARLDAARTYRSGGMRVWGGDVRVLGSDVRRAQQTALRWAQRVVAAVTVSERGRAPGRRGNARMQRRQRDVHWPARWQAHGVVVAAPRSTDSTWIFVLSASGNEQGGAAATSTVVATRKAAAAASTAVAAASTAVGEQE
ncbi:hypothetical protein GGX14DRAFT_391376 [Mycena pura]|uniref:Uncharacterized protein n=1 Tax=Mycena pura TaxID=153505 RepID=A0AAD6YIP1_9AGAR|nr:hypothetical protein GGX14DRAFT_391376 [Mycena pura]